MQMVETQSQQVEPEKPKAPRKRILVGLLALSYVLGLPTVALVEVVAIWLGSEELAMFGGPLIYAASWVLLGVVLVIGGPEISDQLRESVRRFRKRHLAR